MEHFAPHPSATFEGYYTKLALPSGAYLVLVICTIPRATTLPPHMLSLTYYPASGHPIYQREDWVSAIERRVTGPGHAFELHVPGVGSMSVAADGTTVYALRTEEWSLHARTSGRVGWEAGGGNSTPEGWLVKLPLPLHWHVQSLASPATFTLELPSSAGDVPSEDGEGEATLHQEKNWADSFPSAHVWMQAQSKGGDSGICVAGGKILGMHAFIVGFRSLGLNLDFKPPFALSFLGVAPFMAQEIDYESRSVSLTVADFTHSISIWARAPRGNGWFGLGSPFPEGHKTNYCSESFLAEIDVVVYERKWWSWAWAEVRREKFEKASLEFAGEYFNGRGEKRE